MPQIPLYAQHIVLLYKLFYVHHIPKKLTISILLQLLFFCQPVVLCLLLGSVEDRFGALFVYISATSLHLVLLLSALLPFLLVVCHFSAFSVS